MTAESQSEMMRVRRSLETVRKWASYVPSFYGRGEKRKLEGLPNVWAMAGVPPDIFAAFDLIPEWLQNYATVCAMTGASTVFCEEAEADGYTHELCSYIKNGLGYSRRWKQVGGCPPEAPLENGIGEPDLLVCTSFLCDPRFKSFQITATRFNQVPLFIADYLSPHCDTDINNPEIADHYKAHMRAELKALIAFLEEHLGRKMDIDKFRESQKNAHKALSLWHEVLELRKNVPCPMGTEDYVAAIFPFIFMLGTQEATNFFQALLDEVKGRVEQGIGVIPDEKLRLIWFGIPPWHHLGLYNWMESMGAIFPVESTYYTGKPPDVDFSDPLESMVERIWQTTEWRWRSGCEAMSEIISQTPGTPLVGTQLLHELIRDYKIDGAVMHYVKSCRVATIGQIHTKSELAKMGVPTMIFESDMTDPREWSDDQIKTRFSAFLEMVAAGKQSG